MEKQFNSIKIGEKFKYKFLYHWKNDFGYFKEYVIGEFEKIDDKFAYCNEYEEGLDFTPNEIVLVN